MEAGLIKEHFEAIVSRTLGAVERKRQRRDEAQIGKQCLRKLHLAGAGFPAYQHRDAMAQHLAGALDK